MKVTVKDKHLNVRVGKPSVNAPCFQFIAPGSEIEVDGKLYKGDLFRDIDIWLRDEADNFYWSGGVSGRESFESISYSGFLKNIATEVITTAGENVTIAIIDGGVDFNKDFFDLSRVINVNIDNGPIDSDHGVFIAGIIGGAAAISGIASKSKIVSFKFRSDNTSFPDLLRNLIVCLDTIAEISGAVVVNLSQGFADFALSNFENEKKQIVESIRKITTGVNRFVICSAGDNGLLTKNVLFPASVQECLSIGSFNDFHKEIVISPAVNAVTPLVNFTSFDLNFNLKKDVGSSYATAVISSLTACIISHGIQQNRSFKKNELINELKKFTVNKNTFQFGDLKLFQYNIS